MSPKFIDNSLPHHSDEEFDAVYPLKIQTLSGTHWTPVEVAKLATDFLVQKEGTKVLDIGSGVGKFCLVAAALSSGYITGVEQRESLVRVSNKIAQRYQLDRAEFIHDNILSINFQNYDAFYFFNSFEENRDHSNLIDDEVSYSNQLYDDYSNYLYEQFDLLPLETRIATFCSESDIIPESYVMVRAERKGKLKLWIKKH